jgi:hypothetical protein
MTSAFDSSSIKQATGHQETNLPKAHVLNDELGHADQSNHFSCRPVTKYPDTLTSLSTIRK